MPAVDVLLDKYAIYAWVSRILFVSMKMEKLTDELKSDWQIVLRTYVRMLKHPTFHES